MRDASDAGAAVGPPRRALRVQGTSRLAFAATTLALVVLASAGTGLLVSHATRDIGGPATTPGSTAVPPEVSPRDIVVDRAPGTLGVGWPVPAATSVDQSAPRVDRSSADGALPVSLLFLRGPVTVPAHPGAPILPGVNLPLPAVLVSPSPVPIPHVVTPTPTATPDSSGQGPRPAHQNNGKSNGKSKSHGDDNGTSTADRGSQGKQAGRDGRSD